MSVTRHTREQLRSAFWVLPALGVAVAVVLGLGLPWVELRLTGGGLGYGGDAPAARAILSAIATLTVSVVGLAFSVTLVALTLAAQQLSPRVLRTFRRDRLNQATLAAFLATAVYALLVLRAVRVDDVPDMAVTLAFVLVVTSLALFVAFVNNIVLALQPATVVRRVVDDGLELVGWYAERREPPPEEPSGLVAVRAPRSGFLQDVDLEGATEALARAGAVAWQRAAFGDYVVSGDVVAEVDAPPARREEACAASAAAFRVSGERSLSADLALPVRQLADIALRGLSPGLNDPTTAENALGGATEVLVRARELADGVVLGRDDQGAVRVVLRAPDVDALVRLAFAQVRGHVRDDATLALRLVGLLARVGGDEATRQAVLLGEAFEAGSAPMAERAAVRAAVARVAAAAAA